MCTILKKQRGLNLGFEIFCFSNFFVTGKYGCVVQFEICDRVIFSSVIKQREMKAKMITFCRERFDDTSGRLIISLK